MPRKTKQIPEVSPLDLMARYKVMKIMNEKGIKQQQLGAALAGLKEIPEGYQTSGLRSRASRFFYGKSPMNLKDLNSVAVFLGCPPEYLISEDEKSGINNNVKNEGGINTQRFFSAKGNMNVGEEKSSSEDIASALQNLDPKQKDQMREGLEALIKNLSNPK